VNKLFGSSTIKHKQVSVGYEVGKGVGDKDGAKLGDGEGT